MIYVTGDTHRDYRRLRKDIFFEQKDLTKEDYLIVCGDFGIWDHSTIEARMMDDLDAKNFTTLFVDGNHSNYDILAEYPVSDWHGGKVQFIRPSVIHLMRGQIFEIGGKTFFTMGGARSHDIDDGILDPDDPQFRRKRKALDLRGGMYRVNHKSWWEQEMPSNEEYQEARKNLDRTNWSVDYIITHCAPTTIQDMLSAGMYRCDKLTDFLDEVYRKASYRYWLFGHYHDNRIVDRKHILLYEQIIELPEGEYPHGE
jgi:predicted phosphodiesterase